MNPRFRTHPGSKRFQSRCLLTAGSGSVCRSRWQGRLTEPTIAKRHSSRNVLQHIQNSLCAFPLDSDETVEDVMNGSNCSKNPLLKDLIMIAFSQSASHLSTLLLVKVKHTFIALALLPLLPIVGLAWASYWLHQWSEAQHEIAIALSPNTSNPK